MNSILKEHYHIEESVYAFVKAQEKKLKHPFRILMDIREYNQLKVIRAMQENRLASHDFNSSSGYGYGEGGREKVDRIYADVFGAQDALVRPGMASGTHALTLALQGLLLPGDELLCITGPPYDTMQKILGLTGMLPHSLREYGITYAQTELKEGAVDIPAVLAKIRPSTKLIYWQRSMGYTPRAALSVAALEKAVQALRAHTDIPIMVDNCYGEFTEKREPTEVGANLIAGSLIKNPGGGIARSGGYIAGDAHLIDRISYRLTAPGLGRDVGISYGTTREVLQGLYFAPHVTSEALQTAYLFARVYGALGYSVLPRAEDPRSDIVQMIRLEQPETVCHFCEAVQQAGSVDAHMTPVPWEMPGYTNDVIMASAGFVEGSSIEISADGPLREPYHVFYQGGLSADQGKLAVLLSVQRLLNQGILSPSQLVVNDR